MYGFLQLAHERQKKDSENLESTIADEFINTAFYNMEKTKNPDYLRLIKNFLDQNREYFSPASWFQNNIFFLKYASLIGESPDRAPTYDDRKCYTTPDPLFDDYDIDRVQQRLDF